MARSAQKALDRNEPLEWATITHPFHPLHGQRFAILKKRHLASGDTFILRGTERGTFAVACEWTDQAAPALVNPPRDGPLPILEITALLSLRALIDRLQAEPR